MPDVVLAVLVLTVASYVVLMIATSVAFFRIRRRGTPPDPPEWPTVSVVVPVGRDAPDDLPQSLLNGSYPEDRVEIVLVHGPDKSPPATDEAEIPIRRVQLEKSPSRQTPPGAILRNVRSIIRGKVLLIARAEAKVSPRWIQSMVRRCTADTPLAAGPTVVEHEDLFLPRLQALVRVGGLGFAAGLQHLGLSFPWPASNLAIRTDALDEVLSETNDLATTEPLLVNGQALLNPEPEAAVAGPSVASFVEHVRCLARAGRQAVWEASWQIQLLAACVWFTHLILLACALAAVALPAWRQPTLLALLGKMGADALLSVPAARFYGQGRLTRSIVPTELLLVIALPIAGLWALVGSFSTPEF